MDNKTVLIIELKNGSDLYPGIESIILKEIDTYHRKNQVILKSFNKDILNKFKLLAPNVPRLYCTFFSGEFITIDDGIRFEGALKGALDDLGFSYLQIHRYFITKGIIAKAQSKGIKIIVWDVHDKENIQKFSGMGVDFIESDFPDLIL